MTSNKSLNNFQNISLFVAPYKLQFLNSEQIQEGCLIKLTDQSSFGVADICPKIHLGDSDWRSQIIRQGPLFSRAYDLAFEDLQARKEKKSLLADKPIRNNILILNIDEFKFPNDEDRRNLTYKIKFSGTHLDFASKLNSKFTGKKCKLRLDFNSALNAEKFEEFLKKLNHEILGQIEYIEDPTFFNDKWFEWNSIVKLALDFEKPEVSERVTEIYNQFVFIFKPARENLDSKMSQFTVTSSMDHPVGVAHALRYAQKMCQNDSGLLTLDLFKPTEFNVYFDRKEEWLNFSQTCLNDSGIGMTEALSNLSWTQFDGNTID